MHKFTAGVVDTANFNGPMLFSGAWGKMIHEKTRSEKSRDTVPLANAVEAQK